MLPEKNWISLSPPVKQLGYDQIHRTSSWISLGCCTRSWEHQNAISNHTALAVIATLSTALDVGVTINCSFAPLYNARKVHVCIDRPISRHLSSFQIPPLLSHPPTPLIHVYKTSVQMEIQFMERPTRLATRLGTFNQRTLNRSLKGGASSKWGLAGSTSRRLQI